MTITDFIQQFQDDDKCLEYLFQVRYNGKCPHCQSERCYKISTRKVYQCRDCFKQICPTAHTIFHKSSTKLSKWFYAIYLILSSKKGVSSLQLQRELGVTKKCGWRIGHQIRLAMQNNLTEQLFKGIAQVDETYINDKDSKEKGKGKRGRGAGGTPVVGVRLENGKIYCQTTKDVSGESLQGVIKNVLADGSEIHTDNWRGYRVLSKNYDHKTVNHSIEWVSNTGINTNSVENFWSLLKRGIVGIYHCISVKYLPAYLDEFSFRYNHSQDDMFSLLMRRAVGV